MLYKCIEFPKKWIYIKTIKNNLFAPDVSVHIKDDIIYLFTCNTRKSNLKIFYSTDLFNNFEEHPINNTIIKNPRNAGNIFELNNNFYRPSQICTPSYGYAIGINIINELSKNKYSETLIKVINPDWFPELTGTHTFNICNDLLIIDGRLRIKSPNMKKVKVLKGDYVYKSTDNDKYCNSYMNKLLLIYKSIFLNNLPQNIVDKYCKSKNMKIINTNNEPIKMIKLYLKLLVVDIHIIE